MLNWRRQDWKINKTTTGEKVINYRFYKSLIKHNLPAGFTLLELIIVISIISLILAITLPALQTVKRQARALLKMNNQGQIVLGVTQFALDNNGRYPESVAVIGTGQRMSWQEPTMLVTRRRDSSKSRRSISKYLRTYIEEASVMYCPNAPERYKYFEQAWKAGDKWHGPNWKTPEPAPLFGTYCFYWNYTGFRKGNSGPFKGPRHMSGRRGHSELLVSDYFGLGHWRNAKVYNGNFKAYGSCEKFRNSTITPGTDVSSAFWSSLKSGTDVNLSTLQIKLSAGFTDGHVESYSPRDVIMIQVSMTPDGSTPYPLGTGPGGFYLPRSAMH